MKAPKWFVKVYKWYVSHTVKIYKYPDIKNQQEKKPKVKEKEEEARRETELNIGRRSHTKRLKELSGLPLPTDKKDAGVAEQRNLPGGLHFPQSHSWALHEPSQPQSNFLIPRKQPGQLHQDSRSMISILSLHILSAWVLAANPTQRMQKSYTETALFVILKSKVNELSFQNVIHSHTTSL